MSFSFPTYITKFFLMLINIQYKIFVHRPPILNAKYIDCVHDYDNIVKDKHYFIKVWNNKACGKQKMFKKLLQ